MVNTSACFGDDRHCAVYCVAVVLIQKVQSHMFDVEIMALLEKMIFAQLVKIPSWFSKPEIQLCPQRRPSRLSLPFLSIQVKVKVKVTPEQATKTQKGSRDITLLFLLTSALDGGGWSTPPPGRFNPGKDLLPTVQGAGWVPAPVWTGAENLASTGIQSPDRPARSNSLHRLSYHGPSFHSAK